MFRFGLAWLGQRRHLLLLRIRGEDWPPAVLPVSLAHAMHDMAYQPPLVAVTHCVWSSSNSSAMMRCLCRAQVLSETTRQGLAIICSLPWNGDGMSRNAIAFLFLLVVVDYCINPRDSAMLGSPPWPVHLVVAEQSMSVALMVHMRSEAKRSLTQCKDVCRS